MKAGKLSGSEPIDEAVDGLLHNQCPLVLSVRPKHAESVDRVASCSRCEVEGTIA